MTKRCGATNTLQCSQYKCSMSCVYYRRPVSAGTPLGSASLIFVGKTRCTNARTHRSLSTPRVTPCTSLSTVSAIHLVLKVSYRKCTFDTPTTSHPIVTILFCYYSGIFLTCFNSINPIQYRLPHTSKSTTVKSFWQLCASFLS